MKKYFISLGLIFISFIILSFILTLFNYFDVVGNDLIKIIKIVIPFISIFIGSFYLGKHSIKKGYLAGLKIGLIFISIIFTFSMLGLEKSLDWYRLIYYLIILATAILGSMIGITKSKLTN